MDQSRRQMMRAADSALLGPGLIGALGAGPAPRAAVPRKVLYFTKSAGFPHSVVVRKGDAPAFSEAIMTKLGAEHGFEVVASKDGSVFEPDQIGQWDAFAFMTTGDLTTEGTDHRRPISKRGLEAFFEAVDGGKGFLGLHCATDTFGKHRGADRGKDDPYIRLIGGQFAGHGNQQEATIEVADPKFPGASGFGSTSFRLKDEWYGQRDLGDDLHVILTQKTAGMEGKDYERGDYPETWARMQGKGRVFYSSMGHREDVWENPKFQGLIVGGLMWATGQVDIDVTPNIAQVTPDYREVHRGAAKKTG